ncbi:MAG: hypothetical protein MJE12_20440 [Alphaproteobacteria bacterium]|nr:hypothetical protein [Alphaproteobacteria bacterium]
MRRLLVIGMAYSLFVAYVVASYLLVPNGMEDPVYRLTGLPRTGLAVLSTLVAGGLAGLMVLIQIYRMDASIDFGAALSRRRRDVVLLFSVVFLNAVTASMGAVFGDVDARFWAPLYGWVGFVLVLQSVVIYFLLRRHARPGVLLLFLVGFSTFNIYALDLVLMEVFLAQPGVFRAGIVALIFMGLLIFFAAVGKQLVPIRNAIFVLALTGFAPIALLPVGLGSAAPPEKLAPFGAIELRAKPNIHIISFDALAPPILVHKYLGVDEPAYARVLRDEAQANFRNAFASQVPTRQSLNSVMRLAHSDFRPETQYFAGRLDSPLAHLLHANGYFVATGFNNMYMGSKGPYVDAYTPAPSRSVRNSTLCALALVDPLTFFGFCLLGEHLGAPDVQSNWPARVLQSVAKIAVSPATRPAFTFHHLLSPIGHTTAEFRSFDQDDLKRFSDHYRAGADAAAQIMRSAMQLVQDDGVPSILFVMGDHGMYVSRTVALTDDPAFVIQDQFGIVASVLVNETDCTDSDLRHYTAEFATPSRVLAGILRCLARNPDRFDEIVSFDEAYPFQDFLYE